MLFVTTSEKLRHVISKGLQNWRCTEQTVNGHDKITSYIESEIISLSNDNMGLGSNNNIKVLKAKIWRNPFQSLIHVPWNYALFTFLHDDMMRAHYMRIVTSWNANLLEMK